MEPDSALSRLKRKTIPPAIPLNQETPTFLDDHDNSAKNHTSNYPQLLKNEEGSGSEQVHYRPKEPEGDSAERYFAPLRFEMRGKLVRCCYTQRDKVTGPMLDRGKCYFC